MPKSRVSSPQRKTSRDPLLNGDKVRFLGLSLGGGKADKACLAIVDYYPKFKKVFLTKIFEKIKNDAEISADSKIVALVRQHADSVAFLAFDVPWRLPVSLRHPCDCDGIEVCVHPHVKWMWEHHRKLNKKKRPKRIFTPYTQRCVEAYVATELEEPFILNHALGANGAPHLARAAYLHRRLNFPTIEVNPKIALWRIGRSLNIMKSHLRFHRHAVGGDEARRTILRHLGDHGLAFVYEQDLKLMVENNHAFEAFLCAFTAFLKYKKKTEPRPAGFPEEEDWIEIPEASIPWKEL